MEGGALVAQRGVPARKTGTQGDSRQIAPHPNPHPGGDGAGSHPVDQRLRRWRNRPPPPDPPHATMVTVTPLAAEPTAPEATVQLTAEVRDQTVP